MEKKIKWGILGPGTIANSFAKGLKSLPDAEIKAVGAIILEQGKSFAKEYDIPKVYGSSQELADDKEIDIIYIATPHPFHKECAQICLEAGKAVICEKPFTVNAKQAEELIALARNKKIFLTEAMWTRYLPVTINVREWVSNGLIGDVKMVKVDLGFSCPWDPNSRLLNPNLAGGALLDVGIYTISYASMIFGNIQPLRMSSVLNIGPTKVDEDFSAIFEYEDGKSAVMSCSIRQKIQEDAWIIGTKGRIHIPDFWHGTKATLYQNNKDAVTHEFPFESTGYNCEAAEAMRCLRAGKLETDIMPLDETLRVIKTMDSIRKQWALKYPFE